MASIVNKVVRLGTTTLPNAAKATASFARPRLQTCWKYAKVEMKPPTPNEFPQIQQGVMNIIAAAQGRRFLQMSVKEVAVNTAVFIEVVCFFFIGEVIGKRSLMGYYIPGAWTLFGEDTRKKK